MSRSVPAIYPRGSLGFLFLFLALAIGGLSAADLPPGLYARFETPRGVIVTELFYKKAPLTVASFVGLAEGSLGPKRGQPWFNGLTFHRVVPGFVIQGGDPLGTGEGGPEYEFPDEFVPGLRHDRAGVLSMANAGPDTNGSQFFITLDGVNRLNYLHSVFGRVVDGSDVPARIEQTDTMKVSILRVGTEAQAFDCSAAAFEALKAKTNAFQGAQEPGPAAAFDDADGLLPTDAPRARSLNFKLSNFERATGIPLKARLFKTLPPSLAGAPAEAVSKLEAYAKTLGVDSRGAVAIYAHDTQTWWIHAPGLSAGTIEALRLSAAARAEKNVAQGRGLLPAGETLGAELALKLRADAWLDELCFALEPLGAHGIRQ